ncbi:MAG: nucleoside hydrolase [Corallococcus sp.]|nr:nucleoside hydrolase [Corallococcus sp.]MCM1359825.1 nucleoside hydrolase [Corallococcus sp.]MCM1395259.1 nucleoside hydrolase [Corallococcus sp.]
MKNIILDTDIGTDSDDIGALSILCNLARQRKINLLAVTSCTSTTPPICTIDAICNWYGLRVPMGNSKVPYGDDDQHGGYARAVAKAYPRSVEPVSDAVSVLRKALLHGNVTLVTVGPLNNIARLLDSSADEISPKSGAELFRENVTEMYSMAGSFVNDWPEWNVAEDFAAMQAVAKTVTCPWTLIPYEAGINVKTGANFLASADSPMKLGYFVHNGGPRESWDPITSYCAAVECLPTSDWGGLAVSDSGVTTLQKGNGNARYVLANFDVDELTNKLEKLMVI